MEEVKISLERYNQLKSLKDAHDKGSAIATSIVWMGGGIAFEYAYKDKENVVSIQADEIKLLTSQVKELERELFEVEIRRSLWRILLKRIKNRF